MIGTLDIKVNAAHPNMPLSPVYTFLGSPQQVRIINVPKQIGNWKITAVQVTVNYPDNSSPSVEATLVGGCWSATIPAPSAVGQSLMGFKVTASGTDEHGDAVTGYVLGKGDAYVLDDDATITVGGTTYYVHMLDAVPESPHKGDLAVIDNIYQLYDGSRWHPLGNQAEITWAEITGKPTAFPPEAHAASHKTGGTDALTPADIGAVGAVPGKGLSTNDYTNAEKTKLAGIEAGAEVNPTPVAPSTEIEEGATADAKKVANFVNSSINAMAAFYITKNAAGDAFATKAELTAAITSGTFYNGGALRTPTKNDYLYVLADESATQIIPGVNPTTRYSFDGAQWAFQITVNNTALTSAQVAAINSNITAALVSWLSTFKGSDTSTTLASVLSALTGKLDLTGGTLTGNITLSNATWTGLGFTYRDTSGRLCSIKFPSSTLDKTIAVTDQVNAKVGSFAAVGGVTPTVSGGVADVSALFSSVESSTDPQPSGLLNNSALDKAIVKVASTVSPTDVAKSGAVAAAFSTSKTYAVDEVVMHDGLLYRCTTAVTTAGAWTGSTNWTAVAATDSDTAFLKDAQGHLVIKETAGQKNTLYVDAYRMVSLTAAGTKALKDASVNDCGTIAASDVLTLPPAISGYCRDLCVILQTPATLPTFTFPIASTDLEPWSDALPTWAASTVYRIYLSETRSGKWEVSTASKGVTA